MAGKGSRARHTLNANWDARYTRIDFSKKREPAPIWRCTWCERDTATHPKCEHCDNTCLVDRTKPHIPHWSRYSMKEVECKVCNRRAGYEVQGIPGDMCDPAKNK